MAGIGAAAITADKVEEILDELGLSAAEIENLRERRVITARSA